MRNRELVKLVARGVEPELPRPAAPSYILYSRSGASILDDPYYAYWAISRGQATWVTTLLGVKRGRCLTSVDDAARCVREAYERLMDLEVGSYAFRDYQSASTLASIICNELRRNKWLFTRCRRVVIGVGFEWIYAKQF